jgi:deoxyhypusine synthase
MGKMSFTSRDLARATGIYNQMLSDPDCSVILVIAGSTSAGGCMDLYAELVRSNMVDAIVATGATIVDMDFFEALGHKHYQALEIPDDDTLRSLYIDRIYDTYIDEEQLQDTDFTIGKIADTLEPRPYSSREFIKEMGKWLMENGKKENSLVKLAYEHDVPIFCPAFTDSSAGFGLVKHQVDAMKAGRRYMTMDSIADFRELTDIKIKAGTTGLLMIGGGVPKNFTQDTVVCAEILGHEDVECTSMRCRSPSPTSATAPAPPRRSRKPPAGARSRPRSSRWCSPSDLGAARCWRPTPTTAATGRPAPSASSRSCSPKVALA